MVEVIGGSIAGDGIGVYKKFIMKKIYFDTCVISAIVKKDIGKENCNALDKILALKTINLVTSDIAKKEIEKIPSDYREEHENAYNALLNIPTIKHYKTCGNLLLMGVGGGIKEDKLFLSLKNILPDKNDALHIYQAIKNNINDFITTDVETIIKYKDELAKITGTNFFTPVDFIKMNVN